MNVLLVTPPLLQPNTPYAATPLLTAWLRSQGHAAQQADLSLQLLLKLFSVDGLQDLFCELDDNELAEGFLEQASDYLTMIGPVISFLQGHTPAPDCEELPEGPHLARALDQEEELEWEFRGLSDADRDRYLCSLFLDDIAEAFRLHDPDFGFSRYAEDLASSITHFSEFSAHLESMSPESSLFLRELNELTDRTVAEHAPDCVILTVPFPGCFAGALFIARRIRQLRPDTQIILGGGYANTELRELTDPQIFDWVDAICLDSGFVPILRLLNNETPVRTFMREQGVVRYYENDVECVAHNDLPAPVFDGLPLRDYFGMFEVLNPVTRLWSDGKWNKLVLAHGCCWARCAFCDTSIDYVCRYDPATAGNICDWMVAVMAQTGFNGFHFVDEALPQDLLSALCDELIRRDLTVEWWGNVRFEQTLSTALIQKMARAGCIAVTGGLETGSDRTLKLMKKGITVAGASRVLRDFSEAGILTHAYLMYGFPTQTEAETFETLETVRGLFEEGALHSAYWHQFALTAHSEISREVDRFEIRLLPEERGGFARNEIPFESDFGYDLERVGHALRAATYNYQLGLGLDLPVTHWVS